MTVTRRNWLQTVPPSIANHDALFDFVYDAENWTGVEPHCEDIMRRATLDGGHMWLHHDTRHVTTTFHSIQTKLRIMWFMCVSCSRVRIEVKPVAAEPWEDDATARFYTVRPLP